MSKKSPDIKIFVSHRIDQDSETIDNPLYIPVRCGAVFDQREGVTMLGDDTGDNISNKRGSFCELTVQYWAWKNVDADYYGLCHYRRYLSFAKKKFDVDFRNQIVEQTLSKRSAKKYNLCSKESEEDLICSYDAVVAEYADIENIATPQGIKSSVYEHWKGWSGVLIERRTLDQLVKLIDTLYPQYSKDAQAYLSGKLYRGYNCFILKKDLFFSLCQFQFDILFQLEKKIDSTYYSETMARTIGFMGELLYGIFMYHLEQTHKFRIKCVQLVFFENSRRHESLLPAFKKNNIPIVLVSSSYYVPYLSVFLQSLIEHCSPENNYDIIVFHKEIVPASMRRLTAIQKERENLSIRFYNPKHRLEDIKFFIASPCYCEEAYYRILVPWVLENYSKAIVMDCDIIVKEDIAKLFSTDLEGKLLGGVKDIVYQGMLNGVVSDALEYAKETLKMQNPYNYVNTGVLLMDLKQIRGYCTEDDLLSFSQAHQFRIQEQDALNVYFEGQFKFLDIGWNFYVETNSWVTQCLTSAPSKFYRDYQDAAETKDHVYLIHYANIPKPWENPGILYADEFWSVARKTTYYEELIARLIDNRTLDIRGATFDLQNRLGIFDTRSKIRRFADKLLPLNSHRRQFAKCLVPKGSLRWRACKQIYYIFKPQYRPAKQ